MPRSRACARAQAELEAAARGGDEDAWGGDDPAEHHDGPGGKRQRGGDDSHGSLAGRMTPEQCAAAHAALQARLGTAEMQAMSAVRAALPIAQFRYAFRTVLARCPGVALTAACAAAPRLLLLLRRTRW